MKKEYILSDEEKQQKKQKIAENRQKKNQKLLHRNSRIDTEEHDSTSSPSRHEAEIGSQDGSNSPHNRVGAEPEDLIAGPAPKMPKLNNNPTTFQQLLEEPNPQQYEQNYQHFIPEDSVPGPGPGPQAPAQEGFLQDADLNFDNLDEIVAIAIKAEFGTFDLADFSEQAMQPSASSQSTSGIKEESNQLQQHQSLHQAEQPPAISDRPLLNDRERARLDELFVASRALVEPMEHERDVSSSGDTKYRSNPLYFKTISIASILRVFITSFTLIMT